MLPLPKRAERRGKFPQAWQRSRPAANENRASLGDEAPEILCAVADKAYHKAEPIKHLNRDQGITTCIPERDASRRRRWLQYQPSHAHLHRYGPPKGDG